jgi:phosphoribosyl 1,2-cyclic phosphate phosphodiesterase
VCTSNNIKDRRLRASALASIDGVRLLIDCGPDFRQQIMEEEFSPVNGVLLTHEHYDHTGGLDDLRSFCKFADVDLYANKITLDALKMRSPYFFSENKYPGIPILSLHEIDAEKPFKVEHVEIQPVKVMHHKLPILGYRIGNLAYLTDVKSIPDREYAKLKGLDVLIVNALRIKSHLSHLNLSEALAEVKRIAPKRAYLIHMSHHIGLHDDVQKTLPDNVFLSYDGLEIEI